MTRENRGQHVEYARPRKNAIYSLIANSPKGVNVHSLRETFGLNDYAGKKKLRSTLDNLKQSGHIQYDKGSRRYLATHPTSPLMVVRAERTEAGIELTPVRWVKSKASKPFMLVKTSDTEYGNIRNGDKLLVAIQSTQNMVIGRRRVPVANCAVISKIDSNAPVDLKAVFKRNADGTPGLVPAFKATKGSVPIWIDGYEGPYTAADYPENAIVSVQIKESTSQHRLTATVKDLAVWKQEYPASLLSRRDKANGLFRDNPFTPEEEEQASEIAKNAPIPSDYRDMRHIIQFAVDPVDAKDHDDAISAMPDTAPDNPGGWVVTITDIDIVRLVSQMKRASENAIEHPLSAYTNDSVIHMLPKSWAEDAASLKNRQDRFCVSAQIRIDSQGERIDHHIFRSLNAPHQVSYDDVDAVIQGNPPEHFSPEMLDQINHLVGAYEALLLEDSNRGALNFEQGRTLIEKDSQGRLSAIRSESGSIARDIIKKFMVLSNLTFRKECELVGASTIDRIEQEPNIQHRLPKKISPSNTEALFLNREWTREEIHATLDAVSSTPALHQATSDLLIRRVMRPGQFTTDEIGHFGLALDNTPYAPFNSPVRSLADLSNMMSLFDAKGWLDEYVKPGQREWLHENIFGPIAQRGIADSLNDLQPQVKALQRSATRRQAIAYLNRYQGNIVDARIQHVTDSDICLRLADCEYNFTFPLKTISGGAFSTDTQKQCAISTQTGRAYPAGSDIKLRIIKADPIAQQIILSAGAPRNDLYASTKGPEGATKKPDIIVVEAEILEATTKALKIRIGNKDFDLTSKFRGSKSMRPSGLYHYNTGQSLQTGQTRYFKLTLDEKSRITDCTPTSNSFSQRTKLYEKFMKDHGIKPPQEKPPEPSQKRQLQDFSALASLLPSPATDNAE